MAEDLVKFMLCNNLNILNLPLFYSGKVPFSYLELTLFYSYIAYR